MKKPGARPGLLRLRLRHPHRSPSSCRTQGAFIIPDETITEAEWQKLEEKVALRIREDHAAISAQFTQEVLAHASDSDKVQALYLSFYCSLFDAIGQRTVILVVVQDQMQSFEVSLCKEVRLMINRAAQETMRWPVGRYRSFLKTLEFALAGRLQRWIGAGLKRIRDKTAFHDSDSNTGKSQEGQHNVNTASLAVTIKSLREEARLTAEEVADVLQISVRSVFRHESGATGIRPKQIRGYEKLFSEALRREVRIYTKRHTNVIVKSAGGE